MGENETLYSGSTYFLLLTHTHTHIHAHPLMDQISALAHKSCFPRILLPPSLVHSLHFLLLFFLVPSVADSRWVIKIYIQTKVALI